MFETFCVILPNGHRKYTNDYFVFVQLISRNIPPNLASKRRRAFVNTSFIESAIEVQFNLPAEHLIGVLEAYPNKVFATGIAHTEYERLSSVLLNNTTLEETSEVKDHLQLTIVTSIGPLGIQDTDISRSIIREVRKTCSCLLCIPLEPPGDPDILSDIPLVSGLLKLNRRALEVYMPFRRKYYRHLSISPFNSKEE